MLQKILTMDDPWFDLRQDLFGNVEPEVKLEAMTVPQVVIDGAGSPYADAMSTDMWPYIEQLPALAASTSYGSKEKLENDPERAIKLNKNLIKMGHHTPLEAIQLNFQISGISKACGAQISRHRVGQGHVSASRRFQEQAPRFVYPMLSYIEDEVIANRVLISISNTYKSSMKTYEYLRKKQNYPPGTGATPEEMERYQLHWKPLHKEDARFVIPVATATERSWWINVRALRDFFRLRLAPDAEWEIRRVAQMVFNMVYPLMPSLFEDIKEKFE